MWNLLARWDHRLANTNLSAYLDGQLTTRERARLERHLARCMVCQGELATLRATVALLQRTPRRAAPRSFALPMSVQAEQARMQRWNLAYSGLRVAALVVSLVLVVLLSGDALLGTGVLPLALSVDRSAAPVKVAAVEPVGEASGAEPTEQAVTAATPAPERAGVAGGTTPTAEPMATARPAPSVPAARQAVSPTATAAKKAQPEQPAAATPASAAPAASSTAEFPTLAKPLGAGVTSTSSPKVVEKVVEATKPVMAASTATPSTAVKVQDAPPSPTPLLTAPPTLAPTSARVVAQSAPPAASNPTSTPQAQEVTIAETANVAPPLPAVWVFWRIVRLLSGILAGLLLMLLAGVLWTGQKRKV